jgi:phosphoribosylformylglycinamidine synthase I
MTATTAPITLSRSAAFRVAVVRFPGSNCDEDTLFALEHLGLGVRRVWHTDTDLRGCDAVVLPGGFSYGDYLRSGAMAALSPVMEAVARFAARGGFVLGICNGFQMLTEARLLPGALARNASLHFVCRRAFVRVERADTPFTNAYRAGQVLKLPVAHGEGRFVADAQTLARLEGEGQVVFRYATPEGELAEAANPNGSLNHIAGITNERGNVLGLMPHPERAVEALLGSEDGAGVFASLLNALAGAV